MWTEHGEFPTAKKKTTKTTKGQHAPVGLELARLVSSLLYGTRAMLVFNLPAAENKTYTTYDHFHGNSPYGKIPTGKVQIKPLRFTSRLPCHIIKHVTVCANWIPVLKYLENAVNKSFQRAHNSLFHVEFSAEACDGTRAQPREWRQNKDKLRRPCEAKYAKQVTAETVAVQNGGKHT